MIGDLRLWLSKLIKQQITCKHDYRFDTIPTIPEIDYYECSKCGKWKRA